MKKSFLVFAAMVALSGCAGYSVKNPVSGEHYRVYRPQPYLLLIPNEKGTEPQAPSGKTGATEVVVNGTKYIGRIFYLPDYSKPYEIKSWGLLGKANFTFEITDGWQLVKISDQADNSGLTSSLPGLISTVFPGLIQKTKSSRNNDAKSDIKNDFFLFRIIIDENSGQPRLEQVPY